MSSAWRKTLVYLGLVEEPEEHDDLPERFERPDERAAARMGGPPGERGTGPDARDGWRERAGEEETNVRPLRLPAEPSAAHVRATGGSPRVAVVHVARFEDVEDVAARYRSGQPVLFDVSTAERPAARRVLDFVSGTTYALEGRLRRAGAAAFLLVPGGLEVSVEEQERLGALGYALDARTDA